MLIEENWVQHLTITLDLCGPKMYHEMDHN